MKRFFLLPTLLFALLSACSAAWGDGLTVVFLGDFLPAGGAEEFISSRGYPYLFDGVRPLLTGADAVVLNLETPLSRRGTAVPGKTYTFRGATETAAALRAEGVLAVHLANNHILDFGPDAFADTLEALDAAGVARAGAGADEASAYAPAVLSLPGGTLTLLSFSNTFPEEYWARGRRPGTAFGSPSAVERAVRRAAADREGPVVVCFHWGEEKSPVPKDYQRDLARLAIDSGADLVVGHHPHVPQTIGAHRGVPILFSLGNFSFGTYSPSASGLLAKATFAPEGRCTAVEVVPLDVVNTRVLFSPRPLSGLEGQRAVDPLVMELPREMLGVPWDGRRLTVVPPLGGD